MAMPSVKVGAQFDPNDRFSLACRMICVSALAGVIGLFASSAYALTDGPASRLVEQVTMTGMSFRALAPLGSQALTPVGIGVQTADPANLEQSLQTILLVINASAAQQDGSTNALYQREIHNIESRINSSILALVDGLRSSACEGRSFADRDVIYSIAEQFVEVLPEGSC
jgi:hypothetical protein